MGALAAVVYSTDNFVYTKLAIEHLRETIDPELTTIVMVDNGSTPPFEPLGDINIRYEQNIGGNAVFHRWASDDWFKGYDQPEFIAFLHCDLMIHEPGWDNRVVTAFDDNPGLALVGFVGSDEIDENGGRGGGTMLNYAGKYFAGIGQASPAEAHGRRIEGLEAAAVLDHAAMIFDVEVLVELTPQEGHYAPEHFYDRILSCEVLEMGYHIAVLGVLVDHFSGGIGAGVVSANELRASWLIEEGLGTPENTSDAVYLESERRFKYRWGYFFPLKVMPDYSIVR